MAVEIERKFLVVSDSWKNAADGGRLLRQAYIAHESHASVRVRLVDDRAWLTIKSARAGIARDEFEYEISAADGQEMLERLSASPIIEKTRYHVPHAGRVWDVDVFAGRATGLILAEVELSTTDQFVELPDWVGKEVTDDPRFRNSAIALMPSVETAD